MTDSIFDTSTPAELQVDPAKYQAMTPEALVTKAVNADAHIAKIEAENAAYRTHTEQLRQQVADGVAMKAFLEKLEATKAPVNTPPAPQEGKTEGLSKTDVENILAQNDARRQSKANIDTVKAELTKQFGANFQEKVASKAEELGYSKEEFNALAATRPAAFLALVGKTPSNEPVLRQPTSSVNTTNLQNKTGQKNKAFYEKMKSTNRSQWESIETQNEIMSEAMRQGDQFYQN